MPSGPSRAPARQGPKVSLDLESPNGLGTDGVEGWLRGLADHQPVTTPLPATGEYSGIVVTSLYEPATGRDRMRIDQSRPENPVDPRTTRQDQIRGLSGLGIPFW